MKNKFNILSDIYASIQTKKLMLNLLKCRKAGTKCNKTPLSLLDRAEILLLLAPGENVAVVYWVILKTGLLSTKILFVICMKENNKIKHFNLLD